MSAPFQNLRNRRMKPSKAKSGYKWTFNELNYYRIEITEVDEAVFFEESADQVDMTDIPDVLFKHSTENDYMSHPDDRSNIGDNFYSDLFFATTGNERAVDDFSIFLLNLLGYKQDGYGIKSGLKVELSMSGKSDLRANPNICVYNYNTKIIKLIQENKSASSNDNPEPQLIAEAIACFQHNKKLRPLNMSLLENQIFPCLTMIGSTITFYQINITDDLNNAVKAGRRPRARITVLKFSLLQANNENNSMLNIEYRRSALTYLKLFKRYVNV